MKRILLFLLVCGTIFGQNEIVRKLQLVDSLNKKIFYSDTTSLIPTKIFLSQNHYTKSATNTLLGAKLDTTLATSTLRTQWSAGYSHSLLTNNPHSVTALQVGLGNVTNESKATMFTSPTFTGTVTIPSPFTLGAVSVTSTGTQLNYLSGANGTTGTNKVVFDTSPVLVTPTLGVATATSLAIGGATIGTNALAVNGNILTNGYIGAGGTHSAIYPIDVRLNQNANTIINVRNNDSGSSAYASYILNPYGNSWAIRSGSTSANSNALDFVVDILGTPSTKLSISTTGNATFSGAVLHPNGSSASPSISFSGATNTGLYLSAGKLLGSVNGSAAFETASTYFQVLGSTLYLGGSGQIALTYDAANTLALRNRANAQTFRVYGSYTDASNYIGGYLASSTSVVTLGSLTAGTGADDVDIAITPSGAGLVKFGSYTATPLTITGYITIKDSAGNTRKLAIVE